MSKRLNTQRGRWRISICLVAAFAMLSILCATPIVQAYSVVQTTVTGGNGNSWNPLNHTGQRKIVRDAEGFYYVAYTAENFGWTAVRLARSTDGGTSWSWIALFSGTGGQTVAAPAMKQWDSPSIDINWERNTIHVVVRNVSDNELYYTKCVDLDYSNWSQSSNWRQADGTAGTDQIDPAGVDTYITPVVAVDSNNNPHVAYTVDDGSRPQVFYRTHQGGASWSTPIQVSNNTNNTNPNKDPSIDIGTDDIVHILYGEDSNGGSGPDRDSFEYRRSTDYVTFGPLVRIIGQSPLYTAHGASIVAHDSGGEVWAVGGFSNGGNTWARFNYSSDNGQNWDYGNPGTCLEGNDGDIYPLYPSIGSNTAAGATDHKILVQNNNSAGTYPYEIAHYSWDDADLDFGSNPGSLCSAANETLTYTGDVGSAAADDQHVSIEKHKPYWADSSMYCWYHTGSDELRCESVVMTQECLQPFSYFDVPIDVTPARASAPGNQTDWIAVDASSFVPVGATGVLLQVVADPATDYIYGVRRNDVTRCWMISSNSLCSLAPSRTTAKAGTQRFLVAPLDTRRKFQIWTESTSITTYVIGYTGKSTRYFTPTSDLSPVDATWNAGVWEEVDISGNTGSNTAIGAILTVINTSSSAREFSLRKKGSTDDFYYQIDGRAANTFMVGVDGSEFFDARLNTGIELWLRGYVIDGAVFFTNAQDVSAGSAGSYVDGDITPFIGADNANGAILEFLSTDNAGYQTAVRKKWTTHDYYNTMYHQGAIVGINKNDDFEQKVASTNQDVKLIGYTLNDCGTFECNANHWWNCNWSRRRVIHPLNSGRGQLDDFPTLVCLNGGNIDYSRVQTGGRDLRFVDDDDQTVLAHEIEEWNPSGTSYVWVKIPQVDAGSDIDSILMYYDNPRVGDSQDPANVWTNGYEAVWHLRDSPTGSTGDIKDSAKTVHGDSNNMDGTNQIAGQIAGSLQMDGATEWINYGNSVIALSGQQSFTLSAWVRFNATVSTATSFIIEKGSAYWLWWNGGNWGVPDDNLVFGYESGGSQQQVNLPWAPVQNTWYYVAGVHDAVADTNTLYVDGSALGASGPATLDLNETASDNLEIGRRVSSTNFYLDGRIDEARISSTDRSADWINAQNSCMRCAFLSFDAEQTQLTTAVELVSFHAQAFNGAVELTWKTGSEIDNLGFNLYRATSEDGVFEKIILQLIPGLGSSPAGAKYRYTDTDVTNGTTYYYKLEDIETTGATEMHGPVSATPQVGVVQEGGGEGSSEEGAESRLTVGDPEANGLRIVESRTGELVLELTTGGFYATPLDDGTVQLEVPGYDVTADSGYPSLPVRRSWVEILAGLHVELVSVQTYDEETFDGLRPAGASLPFIEARPEGTVRLRRADRTRRSRAYDTSANATASLYPEEAARILSIGFQQDVKKALVEMAPIRWNPSTQRLTLAHRLVVRLRFEGQDLTDTLRSGGRRSRRYIPPQSHVERHLVARFVTTEAGLYGVAYEELFGFRGHKTLPLDSLRLSRQGKNVPFYVDGSVLGPGTTLYFVSVGARANPYGHEAVYELETGVAGELMPTASASPSGEPASFYWERVTQEQNISYHPTLTRAPDRWLWSGLFAPVEMDYTLEVSALAVTAESSRLKVFLQGSTDFVANPDHHVRLYMNDIFVGEGSWNGKEPHQLDADVGAGILRDGDNTLKIENVGDTQAQYSMVMLNRFELTYPRRLVAVDGRLEGAFSLSGTAEVVDISPQAHVLKRGNTGTSWIWLTGVESSASGIRFRAEADRHYMAVGSDALLRVSDIQRPRKARLKTTRHWADLVMVGPQEFLLAARPLIEHRRSQGLKVKAVAIEDVFSEFGFGEKHPQAIKDFLAYAYHNWEQTPRYVLLLGDGTYDFKNELGSDSVNRVPPLMVMTSYLETASDPAYGAVNGEDLLPDLAIGRLPAGTVDELEILVTKILDWETNSSSFFGKAVLVTDNPDAAGNFVADAETLASTVLSGKELVKIYLSQLGTAATKSQIQQAFDDGSSLMNYIGHGGIQLWADEDILNTADVVGLSLQSQQPMLLTMNCLNGYFHFPYFNAMAEELLKAEGKGVVAAFSPSGLSLNYAAHEFHKALLDEVVNGGHTRLGDAVLAAQARYADWGALPEMLAIYHLFGDPTLELR